MNSTLQLTEVRVPDIGDFKNIPVIDVLVKPGSVVAAEDPIVTLESDKATLDVPAPRAGRVVAIEVTAGSRVSCGTLLLTLSAEEDGKEEETGGRTSAPVAERAAAAPVAPVAPVAPPSPFGEQRKESLSADRSVVSLEQSRTRLAQGMPMRGIYAGPSVRRVGRELGVDLGRVTGSGPRGRILQEDVHRWVRERLHENQGQLHDGMRPPTWAPTWPPTLAPSTSPPVDFAKYGEIERQPLSRIRRISGSALARNWATIPHVTNFDQADISELDRLRIALNDERRAAPKISLLSFVVKACAHALKQTPAFNASLDGQEIVLKKYVHIGVAVDTPAGLLVPVLRDVDKLGILEIAGRLADKSARAREGKLKREDMEGGCFSISSLGGIGGDSFTPIINAPEIAILGVGKARIQPRWDGAAFVPRLILPLSLSWDHRALDGALAARFLAYLASVLQDFRRVSL
jgi:pyruvate dehydrogenase E2 component (dihydrolipoamide acetyltransferase)